MLALPGELLHRNQLLLHGEQLRPQVAAHLDEVGLLRRERLLQQTDGGEDRVLFRRPRRIALGKVSL